MTVSNQFDRQMTVHASGVFSPALRVLTTALLVSVGVVAFDGLGVTTALPRIAAELGGMSTYGWAVSALMLASVAGTVIAGYLADANGPRIPILTGFAVFIAGLVMSALATTWTLFLVGRIVQGLGVGAILSMAYLLIALAYPDELKSRALALLSGAWTVPALVGPLVASALAEAAHWRWLFWLLVPLLLVGVVMLLAGMHATSSTTFTREPAGGVARQVAFSLLLAVSSGVFLIGLEMRDPLWTSLVTITGGVGLIVALQRVTPPGTLTVRRGVPAGVATRATLSLSFFGIEVFLPLAMTELRGASLTMAGTTLAAGALVWVAGSLVQSHHEKKAGTHTRQEDTATGLVLLTAGIATITTTLLISDVPITVAALGWAIGGFGMGMAYNATTAQTFAETNPALAGAMSGTIQMAQTLATALIAGIGTAIIATAQPHEGGLTEGVTWILAITVAFALVTIPLSRRIATK